LLHERRKDAATERTVELTQNQPDFISVSPTNLEAVEQTSQPANQEAGFPQFWGIFPFILPKSIRISAYEPSHEELLEDYYNARQYKTKWAQRWLTVCFTIRTISVVLICFRVWGVGKVMKPLIAIIELFRHRM
jgi:hypothetical protein